MRNFIWIYVFIMIVYWFSLLWRFHEAYPASYLLGWALVWPVSFLQWIFS